MKLKSYLCAAAVLLSFSLYSSASYSCDDVWVDSFDLQALHRCKSQAQAGDVEAQFQYGLWLIRVPEKYRNIAAGINWLRISAKNGHRLAPVTLRVFLSHEKLDPTLTDYVEAYAWFAVANETEAMQRLSGKLTEGELARAKLLASEYVEKYQRKNH